MIVGGADTALQCFTYATMFAIESLSLAGEHYDNSSSVRTACEFLLSKQMSDGGWGESYKVRFPAGLSLRRANHTDTHHAQSCETEQYVHHEKSQVVNTAWGKHGQQPRGYSGSVR